MDTELPQTELPQLTDGTVRLLIPAEVDIPLIHQACQAPDIQRWTTVPVPYAWAHAVGFVREYVAEGWKSWSKDGSNWTGELVWAIHGPDGFAGVIGLQQRLAGGAEVGYWMAPDSRGQGLLHRSLLLVIAWVFDAEDGLRYERLEWRAVAGNLPSWRAAWRVGFHFEGAMRLSMIDRGVRVDGWHATLLPADTRAPAAPWADPGAPSGA